MAQYTTDRNLSKRIAIHSFSESPVSWGDWYFGQVRIPPAGRVLDIGCGNGYLWRGREALIGPTSEIHLCDSSPGMLETARATLGGVGENWHFQVADVEHLPFDAESFNSVMANHMLYHAGSVDSAIRELARVIRPDGCLFASTNGNGHMKQLRDWMGEFHLETPNGLGAHIRRFGLENAAGLLGRHFADVRLTVFADSLAVPSVQPVLDYVLSMEPADTAETRAALGALRNRLESEIQAHGRIRIQKESGLFTATRPHVEAL
jgi:SAM-dependent methyltransferase